MIIIYFIVVFFIIIFNILFPLIIDKIRIQNQIVDSNPDMTSITCNNGYLFYIKPTITGLQLFYFIDEFNRIVQCDAGISEKKPKRCGENNEYNDRYNPCFVTMSELLYYRVLGGKTV